MDKSNMDVDNELLADITLDHLPELSDASLSFQIPSCNTSADLLTDAFDLLASDDGRGPSRGLTPTAHQRSPTPLSLGHPDREISIHRQLVSEDRLDHLRAQVATLDQADDASSHVHTPRIIQPLDACPDSTSISTVSEEDAKVISAKRPTLKRGGISKRKTKTKPSRGPIPPQTTAIDPLQHLVPPASAGSDAAINSENIQMTHLGSSGMAERLVSYSQKIISSIGLYKSWSEASNNNVATRTPTAPLPTPQRVVDIPIPRDEPLRLSEISPHKVPAQLDVRSPQHGVSPMQPSKKRLSTDADLPQQYHRRKKGKLMDPERGSSDEAVSQVQARPNNPAQAESTLPRARRKYTPRLNFSVDTAKSLLARRDKRARTMRCLRSDPGDLPLIEKKQNATLPLTKPVGFTFRVDERLEARKRDEDRWLTKSDPGKTHNVPDFKALRASHQTALVVPSVPVPFFFLTEQRAKEREKFDAMMKRKEEEMERLKVEQRRHEEEQEALAIKALRKATVPKANRVPEWYAEMPRKRSAV